LASGKRRARVSSPRPRARRARTSWVVYVLRCRDASLYCGITNDLPARLAAHHAGRGAKYTRGRGPFDVVYTHRVRDKPRALRLEAKIKRLSRERKLALIA
jgi:putative endonuclease